MAPRDEFHVPPLYVYMCVLRVGGCECVCLLYAEGVSSELVGEDGGAVSLDPDQINSQSMHART